MAQGSSRGDRSPGRRPERRRETGSGGQKGKNGRRAGDGPAGKPGGKSASSQGGPRRGQTSRSDRQPPREPRSEAQATYDGPELPADITGRELDRSVAAQLQGLPEKLALRVAKHLVAAGRLLDEDPQLAYAHAKAARSRASRLAVVREACGEAAYAAGEFSDALTELRAAKRMNGANDYLPMIADCERALGKPEKAITLARAGAAKDLPDEIRVELTIVEAGARQDLGDAGAALRTLEAAPLHSRSREPWSIRLRYAYAETLLAVGRTDEAAEWFHRAAAIDNDDVTDAAERALELEGGTSGPGASTGSDSD